MIYPDDFKDAVYKAYPDWAEIHQALEDGSEMVGRYLSDAPSMVDPQDILLCETIEQAKVLARRALAQKRLYAWWRVLWKRGY
jgi:hypothetical protein